MALRDLILKVVPKKTAASMEAESRQWMVRRTGCGNERSVWDIGGLRWKAAGRPRRLVRCSQCGERTWAEIYKKAE